MCDSDPQIGDGVTDGNGATAAGHTSLGQPDDLSRVSALKYLAIILAVAAVLRSVGLTYQLPLPSGPDNMDLIRVGLRMGTGDLNPHWFTWPAAPFYFVAGCYGVMFAACRLLGVVDGVAGFKQWFFDDPSVFLLYLRVIMVAIGLINVAVLYRIGCLLGSRRRGLLAAALLAVTPVDVLLCHYQKAEPMLVLATLLALWALIRWWQRESAGRAALVGAAIGLACAVKYNAAMLAAPAVATAVYHALMAPTDRRGRLLAGRLALGVACVLGVFFALNPYLLLDAGEAIRQLTGQARLMQSAPAPLHQTPVRSYLGVIFPVSFGWVLYALYAAGLVWLAVASFRRRSEEILLLAFALAYCAAMMTQKLVTAYYPMPMVPALALGTAGLVCQARCRTRLAAWSAAVVLLAPAGRSLILDYRLALPDAIFQAEYWVREHIPPGARVAHRHWLPPVLPAHGRRFGVYPWPFVAKITRQDVDRMVEQGVEWFVLTTRDASGCQTEAFGPADAPMAREVRRFDAPETLLPVRSGGVSIWKTSRPAAAPPLASVLSDATSAAPRQRLDVHFEGGVRLLGLDPLDAVPIKPGGIVELPTYWHIPADAPRALAITLEIHGDGGVITHVTKELGYGIDAYVGAPAGQPCVVVHRALVRPAARAKPGRYQVVMKLHDQGRGADLTITRGPGAPTASLTVAEISVQL